jgi:hypothetical protein
MSCSVFELAAPTEGPRGSGIEAGRPPWESRRALATSLLVPFELYELVRKPSLWKAGGILVNVLIVLYLLRLIRLLRRRLASEAARAQ